jgi:bacterial surface protein 26-residue repeat
MKKHNNFKNILLIIILIIGFISYNIKTFADEEESAILERGLHGSSEWRIENEGTLYIGGGVFDSNEDYFYPEWYQHRDIITKIVIESEIISYGNQSYLFHNLYYVTIIEGLDRIDTSNVTNMRHMFAGMNNLTEINLSNFNTENVNNMSWMFVGMNSLTEIDLSNFDTNNVENMENIFFSLNNLSKLTLGQYFNFIGDVKLVEVPNNELFTGEWQNVGEGTLENPLGNYILTSDQLIKDYEGESMSDIYVWRPTTLNRRFRTTVKTFGNGTAIADRTTSIAKEKTITLTAIPNEDNYFKGWVVISGDVALDIVSELKATFENLGEDVEVIAIFDNKSESQLIDNYLYTVKDVVIGIIEASRLIDEELINMSNLVVMDVIIGKPVEMKVLNNTISNEVGTYQVTFTNAEETILIEITVTVLDDNLDNEETDANNTNNNNHTTPPTGNRRCK